MSCPGLVRIPIRNPLVLIAQFFLHVILKSTLNQTVDLTLCHISYLVDFRHLSNSTTHAIISYIFLVVGSTFIMLVSAKLGARMFMRPVPGWSRSWLAPEISENFVPAPDFSTYGVMTGDMFESAVKWGNVDDWERWCACRRVLTVTAVRHHCRWFANNSYGLLASDSTSSQILEAESSLSSVKH